MATDIVQQDLQALVEGWMDAERDGGKYPVPFDTAWQDVNAQIFSFQVLGELARRSRQAKTVEECKAIFSLAGTVSKIGRTVCLGDVGDALVELCNTIQVSAIRSLKAVESNNPKAEERVYFLLDSLSNLVKIGRSTQVFHRAKALESQSGRNLVLLGSFIAKSPQCEYEIHKKFEHLRQKGEWFVCRPELRRFIQDRFCIEDKLLRDYLPDLDDLVKGGDRNLYLGE